jgi:hypothetical protein
VHALNSGLSCPGPEERNCPVDCVYTYESWGTCLETTGKQIRDPIITTPMLNGGSKCPTREERNCGVDCKYKWSDWGVCGSAGKGLHERTAIVETPCFPLNNCPTGHLLTGAPCPPKVSIYTLYLVLYFTFLFSLHVLIIIFNLLFFDNQRNKRPAGLIVRVHLMHGVHVIKQQANNQDQLQLLWIHLLEGPHVYNQKQDHVKWIVLLHGMRGVHV